MFTAKSSEGFEKRWAEFFREWRFLSNCHAGWEQFFIAFKAKRRFTKAPCAAPSELELDYRNSILFMNAFRNELKASSKAGSLFNIWNAAKLGTDERRNCSVLASFFDCFGEHGQGPVFLCHFLRIAKLQQFADQLCCGNYRTRTEIWPLNDPESRVDIEIESRACLIFFEVKIWHIETGGQLHRYLELAERKAGRREWVVIFLTPDGRLPAGDSAADHPKVRIASWSQVAQAARACASEIAGRNQIHLALSQYADFLRTISRQPAEL